LKARPKREKKKGPTKVKGKKSREKEEMKRKGRGKRRADSSTYIYHQGACRKKRFERRTAGKRKKKRKEGTDCLTRRRTR